MANHPTLTKIFDFVETDIRTPNSLVPRIFGTEICSGKKGMIHSDKNLYVLHFIYSGKGKVDGREVGENEIFLLRPHSGVNYEPNPSDPWSYAWVEFDGTLVENYLNQAGFSENVQFLRLKSMDGIGKLFAKILGRVPHRLNRHARNMLYCAYILELFAIITEECGYRLRDQEKDFQELNYERIVAFIDNNYSDPNLTVASIAKEFSYAPSYLTRLFNRHSPIPPCKYITKVRMENASKLLMKEKYKIRQIASLVGYKSQFYFSKTFLAYYGVRPSEYLSSLAK